MLLVDDHSVVREGIRKILAPLAAQWQMTDAADGRAAMELLRQQTFDLVVLDISLPGLSGLELIPRMRGLHPAMAILVLTMHSEEHYAMRALEAGANGYLTKVNAATELVRAVQRVSGGGLYLPAGLAEHVVQRMLGQSAQPRMDQLSNRELDIFHRIIEGQRLTDIAQKLHLSIKTVSTYKRRIQEKLQVETTAALIRFGVEYRAQTGGPAHARVEHDAPPAHDAS